MSKPASGSSASDSAHGSNNLRRFDRFYPKSVSAFVKTTNSSSSQCEVLDFSLGGCRLRKGPETAELPQAGVSLSFKSTNHTNLQTPELEGHIRANGESENGSTGFAVIFDEIVTPENCPNIGWLMKNPSSKYADSLARFARQKEIALTDIKACYDYLARTQGHLLTLFLTAVTLCASLLGLYLALSQREPGFSGWLTFLSALPVVLFPPFGAIFLQQLSSVQKYHAFMTILARSLVNGHFPPNYRGWRDANDNARHCLSSTDNEVLDTELAHIKHAKSLRAPRPTLRTSLMLATLVLCWVASLFAFFQRLRPFWDGSAFLAVLVGMGVAVLILLTAAVFYRMIDQMRRGRYSYAFFMKRWMIVLENSPPYCPSELRDAR